MSSSDAIIGHANPHTIKKFELIEKYVEAWAHKLLQNQYCSGLVFIDCMSNSGEYVDDDGKQDLILYDDSSILRPEDAAVTELCDNRHDLVHCFAAEICLNPV